MQDKIEGLQTDCPKNFTWQLGKQRAESNCQTTFLACYLWIKETGLSMTKIFYSDHGTITMFYTCWKHASTVSSALQLIQQCPLLAELVWFSLDKSEKEEGPFSFHDLAREDWSIAVCVLLYKGQLSQSTLCSWIWSLAHCLSNVPKKNSLLENARSATATLVLTWAKHFLVICTSGLIVVTQI